MNRIQRKSCFSMLAITSTLNYCVRMQTLKLWKLKLSGNKTLNALQKTSHPVTELPETSKNERLWENSSSFRNKAEATRTAKTPQHQYFGKTRF